MRRCCAVVRCVGRRWVVRRARRRESSSGEEEGGKEGTSVIGG